MFLSNSSFNTGSILYLGAISSGRYVREEEFKSKTGAELRFLANSSKFLFE